MNRRRFLELLGQGLAGSAVVYSFPSVIVPKNIALWGRGLDDPKNIIQPVRLVEVFPDGMEFGMRGIRGLAYLVNGTGDYFGPSTVTFEMPGVSRVLVDLAREVGEI